MLEKTVAQTTIAKEVSLTGVGLHTGAEVTMTFKPAMENTGYRFKRVDLEETPTIQAEAQYVVNTQRGTNLEKNGVSIQTSEHVLAALVGLEIDNVLMEHPAIQQVVSFAVADKSYGEEIGGAIVLGEGQSLTEAELKNYANERLARFKSYKDKYLSYNVIVTWI